MSRLIVKNLPKSITEDSLKQIFEELGTVTDVQLKFTPDGRFRQFAFIGFQNENEAALAAKTLNKTFIKTSRISVEVCSTLGEQKSKPWNKKTNDSVPREDVKEIKITKQKKIQKTGEDDEATQLLEKYKDDPLFEEFLQVHVPTEAEKLIKLKTKESANYVDSGQESTGDEGSEKEPDDDDCTKLANDQISDMEYMKQLMKGNGERKPRQKMEKKIREKIVLFTVKLKDLPYNIKKKDIKQFFKPISCYSIRIPRKIHGIAFVGFKTEKLLNKALVKDRSFIKGKQVFVTKYNKVEEDNNNDDDQNKISKARWKNQEDSLKNEEDIAESGRIFFRNLAYTTTENDVEKLFSKYGPLTEVSLPIDKVTRKMKGFGVVTFLMPEHAVKAYSELDGTIFQGRMLHLLPGKNKDVEDENLDESTNYKKKKLAQQKAQAGSVHNWNSLFLGHDAVAEAIAENYGTTKQAVVGPEGQGSAAVRLALGETELVAQTKKYLEKEGVVLDAFNNDKQPRSKTLILVKNLPSRTEVRELREIFETHGEIARIILPPSGITAIIEFLEPSEAKKAFTRLAYSKFKNVPLYLEWAPENSLSEKPTLNSEKDDQQNKAESNPTENEKKAEIEVEEEDEEEPEPETTLFVKNLNFKTTDDDLKKHFETCGKIHYANVATKKDPNDAKNKLSMGYGFVRFKLRNSADKALKTLQQSVLDGKSLELKRSERTLKEDIKTSKKTMKKTKQTGSKILVRNVPFQASKKEIQELFSTFGEIKALRLPKKMAAGSDSHRGFAFVDYTTTSDAKAAFEALSQSTHLYGRRLVLEWASTQEGVDEIRKRTANHFKEKDEVKSKKSVFNIE